MGGNCEDDSDCSGDLRCWVRHGHTGVPYCSGSGDNERNKNFCYDPDPPAPTPAPTPPPDTQCIANCCFPPEEGGTGGWANHYMISVCYNSDCHYETSSNGHPYCSGSGYLSCAAEC